MSRARPRALRRSRTAHRMLLGLGCAVAFLCHFAAFAEEPFELRKVERLHLDEVVPAPGGEQATELFLRAETRFGEPVANLRPVDLVIRDNGELIDPDEVSLSLLGDAGRGVAAVLVIDTSRTMKGEPFQRAVAAALDFVDRLGSLDRVAVVTFASEAKLVAPFGAARAEARVLVEQLAVDDESLSTVLYDGVHTAIRTIRDGEALPRRSFAIVFSDGKDAGSVHTLEELIEDARGSDGNARIPIFTIGYTRFGGAGLETLQKLSNETAAEHFHATSTLHLASFFDEVRRQMMNSYLVRFPADMDGASHVVEVTIEGQTDARTLLYPELGRPLWIWLLLLVVLLAVAAVLVMLLMRRNNSGELAFVSGVRVGESVPLRGSMRLGALADNDIVANAPTVSRYHARIDVSAGRVEIEDLGSRNGTFVNGAPVRKAQLSPGDKLRVGQVELEYRR